MRANTILETIGGTPHLKLNRLFGEREVYVKLERANPGGSIKDRIALAMIEDAEEKGLIAPGKTTLIEPTSGNTGIGLALVAAVKGYRLILTMPESMSIERRRLMKAYGAELDLTPREKGMKGAIERAKELVESTPDSWMPLQFDNQANVEVHRRTTSQEIIKDFPEGIDVIITGVGTGGHITAAAEVLKESWPSLKVYAVEPAKSPVLSGGAPSPHKIQGIGAGFVPAIYQGKSIDGVIQVEEEEAFDFARRAAREEGLFIGVSSGGSLAAVAKKLPDLDPASRILTFAYDTGERYLSVEGLFPA